MQPRTVRMAENSAQPVCRLCAHSVVRGAGGNIHFPKANPGRTVHPKRGGFILPLSSWIE